MSVAQTVNKKSTSPALWYTLAWVLQIFLDDVANLGPVASLLFDFMIAWSFYYVVMVILHLWSQPGLMKAFSALLLMFTVYGILLLLSDKVYYAGRSERYVPNQAFLMQVYRSLFPIYAYYYFSVKGLLTRKMMNSFVPIFLGLITLSFLSYAAHYSLARDSEEITNNIGYTFVSLIPLLFLYNRNRGLQFLYLAYSMVMIIAGMKRGAMLLGGILFCIYMWYLYRHSKGKQKTAVVVGAVFLMIVMVVAVAYMMTTSDYFQSRINDTLEGNTSGRDSLYGYFFDYYMTNMSREQHLFGLGANATLGIFWNYAHNDWLEIAINHGALGLVLYVIYWISFGKTCFRKGLPTEIKTAIIMLFVFYSLKTLISMSYRSFNVYSGMSLGYCLGYVYRADKKARIIARKKRIMKLKRKREAAARLEAGRTTQ